jgi:insertion element IS1 protein InsB
MLGIMDQLRYNGLVHSPATQTRRSSRMRVKLQLVMCSDEDHEETVTDVMTLNKNNQRIEHLGLTLAEAKQLLSPLQQRLLQHQIDTFLDTCSTCSACGALLKVKAHACRSFRTLFGTYKLDSPRLEHCDGTRHKTSSFRPLSTLLTESVAPELLYIEAKWASLVSYGMSLDALKDFLPLEVTLDVKTVRYDTLKVAKRLQGCWVVFQKWRWTEIAVTLGLVFVAPIRKEWPMTFIAVRCPHCQSDQIVKRGKTARGTQRYLCQNTLCVRGSFLLDYCNRGCLPEVKQTIIDMSLNASGIRDTARSLHICPNTVLRELKKKATALESVNTSLLRTLNPAEVAWDLERAGEAEAEMDEMWSFVRHKGNPRWLWHAIDHATGKVLAYVFGRRKDEVFLRLKALLEPFGLTRYYTDYWGAYTRHLDPDEHCPGKRNTQKIERKHLTLRTRIKRLARKTICFSKTTQMHDVVIGLFVNRYAFGRAV